MSAPFETDSLNEAQEPYRQRNVQMNQAWQFVANTDVSVFLTGKAGTGKTTFLKKLRQLMPKRMVVLAPTGVAAINAEGQTINSFFQLPFGPYIPGTNTDQNQRYRMAQNKKDLIRTLDLLVIDEISMVRADMLDQVDDALRRYRDRHKPFGGVQLLLIGDLMQLSPVAKPDEWQLLKPYYDTPYFFSSHALSQINYVTIELKHIYRQQDQAFIDLLGEVRNGRLTRDSIACLNKRYIPDFRPSGDDWIRLTTHNAPAQQYNEMMLRNLPGSSHRFKAEVKDEFPEYSYPADFDLLLKEGAQVMFIKNDPSMMHEYYNGKIGVVTGFGDNHVEVTCDGGAQVIKVPTLTWENTKYALNPDSKEIEEHTVGTFTQYPLRLAWAITVHKSQGLTFDHAVLDINDAFTHGQVYVALSRCRTLEGMVLSSPLRPYSVMTDPMVNGYINESLSKVEENVAALPKYMKDYTITLLDQLFDLQTIDNDLHWLVRVIDEHLSTQQPGLLATLKSAPEPLAPLKTIAAKFGSQYRVALQESHRIEGTPLEGRIRDACAYFDAQLHAIIAPILKMCVINIDNASIAETYNNALSALRTNTALKSAILGFLSDKPFSANNYLSIKSKALLKLSDAPQRARQSKSSKKGDNASKGGSATPKTSDKAPAKPKKAKGDTLKATLSLYNEGLSIDEIAAKRSLAKSTIYGHMSQLINQGYIDINDIVSPEHQLAVARAAETFDSAFGLKDIMELLPDDYDYNEVRLILNCTRTDE